MVGKMLKTVSLEVINLLYYNGKEENIMNAGERMAAIEVEVKEIQRRMDGNDESHLRIEKKIDGLPALLSEKFAPQWVEKAFWWIITVVTLSNATVIYFLNK